MLMSRLLLSLVRIEAYRKFALTANIFLLSQHSAIEIVFNTMRALSVQFFRHLHFPLVFWGQTALDVGKAIQSLLAFL